MGSEMIQVRLIAGRTGVGRRGDVVQYSPEDAERYVSLGVAEYVAAGGESGPAETAAPTQPADDGEAIAEIEAEASDEPQRVAEPEPYKRKPLRQKRRR
jgi:hypothetical protein